MPKIVTLTTDFGLHDPYVAEMKGVILGICLNAVIVDITHNVEKFNIRQGAFMLASAAPYFPPRTIHIAVVDPGVGTQRRPIIVQTEHNVFVGPDNGVLMLAAEAEGIKHVYKIEEQRFLPNNVSNTFHGRDVFAPVVAHIANGDARLEEFGPEINDAIKPQFSKARQTEGGLVGEVLHVDSFGNIITNIHTKDFEHLKPVSLSISLSNLKMKVIFAKTYAEAKPHEPLALIGSHNYLEIALNQGNAAAKFRVKVGDRIILSPT
ncbi:MAG: S-adenosyl-l-methionine hydroxide adenosyltransferase family protein [Candidatus Bathyarchaeota archaeon]|nr:S-adenosyl-l-methionine hydroxide adenosyltransferase family protein [Candidatus Bathyarchaeota archaeon]